MVPLGKSREGWGEMVWKKGPGEAKDEGKGLIVPEDTEKETQVQLQA